MFYKINKGSKTENEIKDFISICEKCVKETENFVKELGGNRYVMPAGFFGGINYINFDEDKVPTNWIEVKYCPGFYRPRENRKSTKEIIQKMKNLPKISNSELNKILNFKQCVIGNIIYESIEGWSYGKDCVAYIVNQQLKDTYVRPTDVVEITSEEYDNIKKLND